MEKFIIKRLKEVKMEKQEISLDACMKQYRLMRKAEVPEEDLGCLNCNEEERKYCVDYRPLGEWHWGFIEDKEERIRQ